MENLPGGNLCYFGISKLENQRDLWLRNPECRIGIPVAATKKSLSFEHVLQASHTGLFLTFGQHIIVGDLELRCRNTLFT